MPTVQQTIQHGQPTRRNELRYQFTPKHHGGPGSKGQAQWEFSLSLAEEFSVFDEADWLEIVDAKGNMYGVLKSADGELRDIGSGVEQMAKFPKTKTGPWHGYPCWPINKAGPSNRRKQKMFPPKRVFNLLEEKGLISEEQRDRLKNGSHA